MASIRIEDATVSVEDSTQADREGRPVFEWTVSLDSGESWSATDLKGPACGAEPSEEEMLATLLVFLGAAIEAREYGGENEDLFPAELLDWAAQYSDEIAMLAFEMEEAQG